MHALKFADAMLSLSARRAWIEISGVDWAEDWLNVALRKESVDRNIPSKKFLKSIESLSARRAWIEITGRSVEFHLFACRSPQGERG